jgi:hypothetical protein
MADLYTASISARVGKSETPLIVTPGSFRDIEFRCSRLNWPAAGATLQISWSFDGATFNNLAPIHIAAWKNDGTGKHPLSDAVIGFGWGRRPTHVKAAIVSTKAFSTRVTVRAN